VVVLRDGLWRKMFSVLLAEEDVICLFSGQHAPAYICGVDDPQRTLNCGEVFKCSEAAPLRRGAGNEAGAVKSTGVWEYARCFRVLESPAASQLRQVLEILSLENPRKPKSRRMLFRSIFLRWLAYAAVISVALVFLIGLARHFFQSHLDSPQLLILALPVGALVCLMCIVLWCV
jgi:hypothetical protein